MSFSDIPPEIVDMIIDFLHDAGKETLATCSLVCTQWLSSSRFHLFSKISLKYSSTYHEDADYDIRTCLRDHQSLFPLIRDLTINGVRGAPQKPLDHGQNPSNSDETNVFRSILVSFPALHTLTLHRCNLTTMFPSTEPGLPHPISLRKLVLSYLNSTHADFWKALSLFSSIDELQVLNSNKCPGDLPWPAELPFPTIRSLVVDHSDSGVSTLTSAQFIPLAHVKNLTRLSLRFEERNDPLYPVITAMMESAGPRLEYLRLDVADVDMQNDGNSASWDIIPISLCQSLRTLHVCLYAAGEHQFWDGDNHAQWSLLLQFLSHLPASSNSPLEHVIVALLRVSHSTEKSDLNAATLDQLPWKELDDRFARFGKLQSVQFRAEGRAKGDCAGITADCKKELGEFAKGAIRDRLPRLDRAGKLVFYS